MVQAAGFNRSVLYVFSPFNDGCATPEVGVGGCDVADALVASMIVVMIHEGGDLVFKVTGQEVVFQQYLVLEGLMLALDFTLCLRMVGGSSNVIHTVIVEPVSEIAGDIR